MSLLIIVIRFAQNTPVGDAAIRGVSGGEKKRVSIAEALATRMRVGAWDKCVHVFLEVSFLWIFWLFGANLVVTSSFLRHLLLYLNLLPCFLCSSLCSYLNLNFVPPLLRLFLPSSLVTPFSFTDLPLQLYQGPRRKHRPRVRARAPDCHRAFFSSIPFTLLFDARPQDIDRLTTLVSIYQAGETLYTLFDKVIVLYDGRMAYFGSADRARAYFEGMGCVFSLVFLLLVFSSVLLHPLLRRRNAYRPAPFTLLAARTN